MTKLRIAVTGASGFIGRHVIAKAESLNAEIHVFGRKDYGLPGVYNYWDATIPYQNSGMSFDAIIHCAAATVESGRGVSDVNVQGTINALAIDPEARFIYVSSASVYGHQGDSLKIKEHTAGEGRWLNDYAESKYQAELLVSKETRKTGTIILRPHAVYGPGDTTLLPRLEQKAKSGSLCLPNGGEALLSITRFDGLVQTIFDVIMCQDGALESGVHAYNVADKYPVPLWNIVEEISQRRKPMKIKKVGLKTAWFLASSLEFVYTTLRLSFQPPVTRYMVSQLGYNMTLDVTAIEVLLGRDMMESDFSDAGTW